MNGELASRSIGFDYPPITIPYNFFCFTGHFHLVKRKFCEEEVIRNGGILKLNRLLNCLVIGSGLYEFMMEKDAPVLNNKIETVLKMKAAGISVSIISEHHFVNGLKSIKAPEIGQVKIESFSVGEKEYEVSLKELTCSCPNFMEDRAKYQRTDPIRLCKHLIKALVDARYVPSGLEPHVEKIAVASVYGGGIPGFKGNTYIAY